jgi:hypothetical protein
MKFRHVPYAVIVLALAAAGFASLYASGKIEGPHSPKPISLSGSRPAAPGSGHAFGYGVVYTIVAHKKHDGRTYVVVKSDEPGVEIWSPIILLVAMKDGYKFTLSKDDSFEKALHIVSADAR